MFRAIAHLPAIAFASAVAAAPAIAAPTPDAPPPAAPGPVAVPYPNTAPSIEVMALSWRAADAMQPQVMTSDPQEGGEIARKNVRKTPKPTISELTVSKKTDVSSPTLLRSTNESPREPGKLEIPNIRANGGGANPPPAGTATITVARGHCASGQHFPFGQADDEGAELHAPGCRGGQLHPSRRQRRYLHTELPARRRIAQGGGAPVRRITWR